MSRFDHEDHLVELDRHVGIDSKLVFIHQALKTQVPQVSRIAAALYDDKTDTLKTFAHSSDEQEPLTGYEAKLAAVPSLGSIFSRRRPRIIDDLSRLPGASFHTVQMRAQGHRSSYTMPMFRRGLPIGLLFFNAREKGVFTEPVLRQLDPYGHLMTQSIINEQTALCNLQAAVTTTRGFHRLRDDETAAHQERMCRFARLIAQKLMPKYDFSDEFVEHLFLFAPLHDIGKLAIPDRILFKPGALDVEEFALMKTHPLRGREMIEQLLHNFALEQMPHVQVLRNIVEFHHETMDGSGYPRGLAGADIPIEARIAAVADVFDALTSRRPYKEAWSNDAAYALLAELSGPRLDPDCVGVMVEHRREVEAIQAQFVGD